MCFTGLPPLPFGKAGRCLPTSSFALKTDTQVPDFLKMLILKLKSVQLGLNKKERTR